MEETEQVPFMGTGCLGGKENHVKALYILMCPRASPGVPSEGPLPKLFFTEDALYPAADQAGPGIGASASICPWEDNTEAARMGITQCREYTFQHVNG